MATDIDRFTIGTGEYAIEFLIMANEPFTYSNGETGPARTVTYMVPGGKGPLACDALYGVGAYAFVAPGGGIWPFPHRFPNNVALTVHSVQGKPAGAKGPDPQLMRGHPFDMINADYSVNGMDTDGSQHGSSSLAGVEVPWSRLTRKGSSETHPIPKEAVRVNGTEKKPAYNVNVKVPIQEYIWERGMLPNFAEFDAILQTLEGTMNQYTFFGFPTGTLFLDSSDSELQFDAAGGRKQKFSMAIRHRPYPWNTKPDPDQPDNWVPVTTADGNSLVPMADFSPLIEYLTVAGWERKLAPGWDRHVRQIRENDRQRRGA
jgi:hypothetical protein